ncbi:MAG: nuclear transport factor 2 family protein [Gammaproteobacteria bacterium]|nr:nuclear transport factor 2 family protein [Gammaproteobacteria bacterium]
MNVNKKQSMNTEFVAVTNVISNYFDGLYNSDTAILSEVFHPRAHYVCATDGTLLHLNMDEYFPIVDKRPSPASRGEKQNDRILSVEFAGPVTAYARVECSIATKFFTDFLTLIFVGKKWKIISKVFHYDIIG